MLIGQRIKQLRKELELSQTEFAENIDIVKETMKDYITEYEYSGIIDSAKIKDSINGGLLKKKKLSEKIKHFIIDHVSKFSF